VVVVVSHDRYFLNRVCTGILAFEGNGVVTYSEGNYDYYLEKKQRQAQPKIAPATQKAPIQPPKAATRPVKLTFKEARELESMESQIAEAEARITELEAVFADPDFHRKHGARTEELTEELAREKEQLDKLFQRWEELEKIRLASERQ
jgi:ABC transport system ATP-binding/permease protein